MVELDTKTEIFFEHNINPVILELLYEYAIQLTGIIANTYLGDKYYDHYKKRMRDQKIQDHFMYCSSKVDKHFEKLGYTFINDPKLATYFFNFFEDNFYSEDKKDINKLKQVLINKLSFIHIQGGLSDNKLKILKEVYNSFLYSFRAI